MAIAGYNHVCVVGAVANGPWHRPRSNGKAESAALTLSVPEMGKDGEEHRTFVPVVVYGKQIVPALDLCRGDTVLAEGKLSWQKNKDKAGLAVTCWRIVKLGGDNPMTG